jgi:hypothetical protein
MNDLNNNCDWKEYIRKITKTKKIEKAAIINKNGEVLCASNDLSVVEHDVMGFNCAFSPPFELYSPVFYQTLSLHKYTSREYLNVLVLLW